MFNRDPTYLQLSSLRNRCRLNVFLNNRYMVQSKKHVVLLNHEVCANNLHVGTLLLIYFTTLRAFCCTIYFLFYCDCHATHSTRDYAWSASCMRRKISTWETTMELICTPWLSYVRICLHLTLKCSFTKIWL